MVDGPGGLLPKDPWKLRREGAFEKLPLLSGICRDDGSAYTGACEYLFFSFRGPI